MRLAQKRFGPITLVSDLRTWPVAERAADAARSASILLRSSRARASPEIDRKVVAQFLFQLRSP